VSLPSCNDCVLDVAAAVLADKHYRNAERTLRAALRVVANCCADNNVNRSFVLWKGTIQAMRCLLFERRCLDLLIPTLYNACTDYDVVATSEKEGEIKGTTGTEMALGTVFTGSQDAAGVELPGLELLLRVVDDVDESHIGFLAELINMASKPPNEDIFGEDADTHFQQRATELLHNMLEAIPVMCAIDEDAKEPLMQATLRITSALPEFIAESPALFHRLRSMLQTTMDSMDDAASIQEAYTRLVYDISSQPSYADAHAGADSAMSDLIRDLLRLSPHPRPPQGHHLSATLVLITNTLKTHATITSMLSRFPDLPARTSAILREASDPAILIPTLDLACRIALHPQGQATLLEAHILENVTVHLETLSQPHSAITDGAIGQEQRTSSHTLRVQGEFIALARLVIKSHPRRNSAEAGAQALIQPALSRLAEKITTLHTALGTSEVTAPVRFEAGKFVVEYLRFISTFAPNTAPPASSMTPSSDIVSTSLPGTASALLDPTRSLVLEATTSSVRAEGVFGLGLLLSLPSLTRTDQAAIVNGLMAQSSKLVDIFRAIVEAGRTGVSSASLEARTSGEKDWGPDVDDEYAIAAPVSSEHGKSLAGSPDRPGRSESMARALSSGEIENLKVVLVRLLSMLRHADATAEAAEDTQMFRAELEGLARTLCIGS
jgi:hypothetical protein